VIELLPQTDTDTDTDTEEHMSYHQDILDTIARSKYLGKAALSRPFSCQIFMVPSEEPEAK
jgi:hypothetical protein